MKKKLLLGAFLVGSIFAANAQLNEDFEGTFPPEGWTIESTNTGFTWEAYTDNPINGTGSASVAYDPAPADQDESLISPEFTLPEGAPILSFNTSLSYYWAVSPESNYDFIVSISNDGGANWTAIWDETDLGEFDNYVPINVTVILADYAGDDVQLKFQYVGNDGAQLVLDDISIIGCIAPSGFIYSQTTPPTTTSVTLEWNEALVPIEGYEYEYGPQGFEQGSGTLGEVTEASVSLSDLDPSSVYDIYIRTTCTDTDMSEWVGPISFNTIFEAADLDYSYGFEQDNLAFAGWSAATVTGSPWTVYQGDDTLPAQEGDFFAGVVGAATAADTWLFSRGVNLVEGEEVSLSYYLKRIVLSETGDGNINSVTVTVGTDTTAETQTTVLTEYTEVTDADWSQKSSEFTAPADGVYYFAFHCTSPAHTAENQGALLLDSVVMDSNLSTDNILSSQFSVYPNPANNVINISNADNVLVNGVEIVDINGRVVKSAKFDNVTEAQINVADLSAGMYLMTISSDSGTTTKKIVKN